MINTKVLIKEIKKTKPFDVLNFIILGLFALLCLLPGLTIFSASIANRTSFLEYGYTLLPRTFDVTAYRVIMQSPAPLLKAYAVSIFVTVSGTLLNLLFVSLMAFPLSRNDFIFKKPVTLLLLFTMLFSAGLVPRYFLIVSILGWKDNLLALIIPGIGSPFFIILMRTFFKQIPNEVVESALIDGAGRFKIYARIMLPLAIPSLATCAVLISLNYWNDWYSAFLYITNQDLRPIQLMMTKLAQDAEIMKRNAEMGLSMGIEEMSSEAVIMATCIIGTAPVLIIFLLLQRFIVKGMTIGAIKG